MDRFWEYNIHQIVDAMLDPTNRDEVRKLHKCDDYELQRNPRLLLQHYVDSGRAKEWAEKNGGKHG